jgi:hypothetical protein
MAYQPIMTRAYDLCERFGGPRFARVFLGQPSGEGVEFGTSTPDLAAKYRVLDSQDDGLAGMRPVFFTDIYIPPGV